jgi:hypothetical protein
MADEDIRKPQFPGSKKDKMDAMKRNAQSNNITGKDSKGRLLPDRIMKPRDLPKNDAFDLQRQKAKAETEEERVRTQENLQKKLAQQGLQGGTALKQQQLADIELKKQLGGKLTDIGIQEALTAEEKAEAERLRRYQTGERLGTQKFQSGETAKEREFRTGERLGTQEFTAGQTKSSQEFQSGETAKEREFKADQADIDRIIAKEEAALGRSFTASERQAAERFAAAQAAADKQFESSERRANQYFASTESQKDRDLQKSIESGRLNVQQAQLAQDARQFNNKMSFDRYALERGYQEADANRAWEENQAEKQREWETSERLAKNTFDSAIQKMQNEFDIGKMNLSAQLDNQSKMQTQKADTAYKIGLSGKELSPERLLKFSEIERNAYLAGLAGKDIEEYQSQRDNEINFANALMANIDPEDPQFTKKMEEIASRFDLIASGKLTPEKLGSQIAEGLKGKINDSLKNINVDFSKNKTVQQESPNKTGGPQKYNTKHTTTYSSNKKGSKKSSGPKLISA